MDDNDAPSPRVAAVARLKRAASQREMRNDGQPDQSGTPDKPKLQRTASERARDMAMAKLMGNGPEPAPNSNSPSFRTAKPPPTLEELQKRHVDSRPSTPATPASPNLSPSLERNEARANLIRKLSRGREGGGLRGAAARQRGDPSEAVEAPPIPLQPFEVGTEFANDALQRSDSTSSLHASVSTAPTSRTSRDSEEELHITRKPPPTTLPIAPTSSLPSASHASSEPTTASFSSDPDSSPTDTMHSRVSHAPSIFRAYRHTMERDRDSAIARMTAEDLFEFDNSSGPDTDSPRFPVTPNPAVSPSMPSSLNNSLSAPQRNERERQASGESTASSTTNGMTMLLGPHAQAAARASARQEQLEHHHVDGPQSSSLSLAEVGLGLSTPTNGRHDREGEDEEQSDEDRTMTVPYDVSPAKSASRQPLSAVVEPGYRFPGPAPSHSLEHAALRGQMNGSPSSSGRRVSPPNGSAHSPSEVRPRPRKSSLSASQHSITVDRPHILAEVPPRASSRTTSRHDHSRNESQATSYRSATSRRTYDDALSMNDSVNDSSDSEWEERAQRRVESSRTMQAQTKQRILSKLGTILQSADAQALPPTSLDDPPRRLLLHAPVLQVVNANTVKDRYLFLFNDVLLIAKPLVDEDPMTGDVVAPTLETRFLVKSVVEVNQLKLTAARDEDEGGDIDSVAKRKHPQLLAFVDRFGNDPRRAVSNLVAKGGIANDAATIANLLFRTPELNRSQLGAYLAARESRHVLKAYVDRFRLTGIRIEDGLRAFLASIRLPNDLATAEHLLTVFATVWLQHNPHASHEATFARKLVVATLELNDFVNSGTNDEGEGALGNLFGFPNPAVSVEDFIAAFRVKDPTYQCTDETLTRIYLSIKKEPLRQAADNSIASVAPEIPVTITPARMPHRLTYRVATQEFTVTIPRPDPNFSLKLVGHDLRAEPPLLSFARTRTQTFRVTGLDLGHKTLLFLRLGPHAMHYAGVPVNRSFSVERAFMKHTFQLAFVNHLGVKRKYMFSMQDAATRSAWVATLSETVEGAKALISSISGHVDRAGHASRAVALQVMRDALIAPDELPAAGASTTMGNGIGAPPGTAGSRFMKTAAGASRPGSANTAGGGGRIGHQRSNSVSKTYAAGLGRDEVDPAAATTNGDAKGRTRALAATVSASSANGSPSLGPPPGTATRRGSRDEGGAIDTTMVKFARTGHDLVLLARQNSLLPSVLGLMNSLQESSSTTGYV